MPPMPMFGRSLLYVQSHWGEVRNAVPVIPIRKTQKRRVATRYDKTAESFPGFIDITSICIWHRHLST